jgi:hypothetical protein
MQQFSRGGKIPLRPPRAHYAGHIFSGERNDPHSL